MKSSIPKQTLSHSLFLSVLIVGDVCGQDELVFGDLTVQTSPTSEGKLTVDGSIASESGFLMLGDQQAGGFLFSTDNSNVDNGSNVSDHFFTSQNIFYKPNWYWGVNDSTNFEAQMILDFTNSLSLYPPSFDTPAIVLDPGTDWGLGNTTDPQILIGGEKVLTESALDDVNTLTALAPYIVTMTSDGKKNVAMGDNTPPSGFWSWATTMGQNTTASDHWATAMGRNTHAARLASTAMGFETNAWGNYSTATGNNTTAQGDSSFSSGHGTIMNDFAGASFGQFNRPRASDSYYYNWTGSINNSVFEIGVGTSESTRRNAVTVLQDGSVELGLYLPAHAYQNGYYYHYYTPSGTRGSLNVSSSGDVMVRGSITTYKDLTVQNNLTVRDNLIVEEDLTVDGTVILTQRQGDISMGIFGPQ